MSMSGWAENEIKLACKKENPDWDGESFDYGCSCYQSALKAYKSICEDGHSGFSYSVTKNILKRLLDELPLTPIEDTPDNWNDVGISKNGDKKYQCNRMPSLFKNIDKDGNVTYSDVNRSYCQELTNPKDTYSGFNSKIVDKIFPITMPYYPKNSNRYKVITDTFLAKGFEGDDTDFNTRAVLYVITPENEKVEVNEYYGEKDKRFVRITKEEYETRLKNRINEKE